MIDDSLVVVLIHTCHIFFIAYRIAYTYNHSHADFSYQYTSLLHVIVFATAALDGIAYTMLEYRIYNIYITHPYTAYALRYAEVPSAFATSTAASTTSEPGGGAATTSGAFSVVSLAAGLAFLPLPGGGGW